eukprot:762927-Hanusia_phi.AAC.6
MIYAQNVKGCQPKCETTVAIEIHSDCSRRDVRSPQITNLQTNINHSSLRLLQNRILLSLSRPRRMAQGGL